VNNNFAWDTLTMTGLTAAHFRTWSNVNAHPDFSASGAPILLGFATGNDNGGSTLSRAAGFDNWSMTVTQVPEPSTAVLLGIVGLGLLVRRRTD